MYVKYEEVNLAPADDSDLTDAGFIERAELSLGPLSLT